MAVPWAAILVVYGLTQISASLPLTPGGIGVVAGSLAALLHAYGVPVTGAVAVVLLYRIVSFWGLVPVGWATWAVLDFRFRHRLGASWRLAPAGRGAAAGTALRAPAGPAAPPARPAGEPSPAGGVPTRADPEPVAAGGSRRWDGR